MVKEMVKVRYIYISSVEIYVDEVWMKVVNISCFFFEICFKLSLFFKIDTSRSMSLFIVLIR